jgi:hypothetical protein
VLEHYIDAIMSQTVCASASLGAYNFREDAIEGCESWNDQVDDYITNVTERYRTLSQMVNHLQPN